VFANPEGYERLMGRWSRRLAEPFIDFARIADGDRVIDIGAGTGSLALAIGARFQRCQIVGIEPVAAFVEYARAHSPGARIRFDVGDGRELHFPDRSFDKALALLVLHFVEEPRRAVAEMRRVTRPGGTVAACGWEFSEGMTMSRLFWDTVVELDPEAEPQHSRHAALGRQGEHAALWRDCGLLDVEERALVISMDFSDFDDFWSPYLAGATPTSTYVAGLPADRRRTLEERLRERLLKGGPDRPFSLDARAWAVRGVAP
jgi:SAM-dependent methyltransferase